MATEWVDQADLENARVRFANVPTLAVPNVASRLHDSGVSRLGPHSDYVKTLQLEFDNIVASTPQLLELLASINSAGLRVAVFGGWARDHLTKAFVDRGCGAPRDIDFVVDNVTTTALRGHLPVGCDKTLFGGFMLSLPDLSVDIWPLAETFFFVRDRITPTFESLMTIVDFNINAIVFFPQQHWGTPSVIDGGSINAITARTIDFRYPCVALPTIQAARIIIYESKLNFMLSSSVEQYLRDICADQTTISTIAEGITSHCPPELQDKALKRLNDFSRGYES
jgi:hypothetical protein